MSLRPFHLAFPVDDLAAARDFYGSVMGCAEGRSSDEWIDFDFYGHQIVTHLAPGQAGDRASNQVDGLGVPVPHFGIVLTMEDWQALDEFREGIRVTAEKGFLTTGSVVFELSDGFEAFVKGNWSEAHRILTAALPSVVRIGGSRAQRRLVDETIASTERHL